MILFDKHLGGNWVFSKSTLFNDMIIITYRVVSINYIIVDVTVRWFASNVDLSVQASFTHHSRVTQCAQEEEVQSR